MNRRKLLATAGLVFMVASLVLSPNLVRAQDQTIEDVVHNVVHNRAWETDPELYFRLRWGAFHYNHLERQFGTPDRELADNSAAQHLQELLPRTYNEWLNSYNTSYVESNEYEFAAGMIRLYEKNFLTYLAWFDSLGILASGRIANAMLSGQAFATLVSLSRNDVEIDNLQPCFFPFCS